MTDPLARLSELTSRYVTARDNFAARYRLRSTGVIATSAGGPLALDKLITDHAVEMARLLPTMTLAQWEGFSELASSYLAKLRMEAVAAKRNGLS
jgi:hypothetical protein